MNKDILSEWKADVFKMGIYLPGPKIIKPDDFDANQWAWRNGERLLKLISRIELLEAQLKANNDKELERLQESKK